MSDYITMTTFITQHLTL